MHFGGIPFGGMPGGMGGMGGGPSEDVDTEKLYEVLGVPKDANEKVRPCAGKWNSLFIFVVDQCQCFIFSPFKT